MAQNEGEDIWSRYQITKEVFEHQLDMTKHEDDKAGRILSSIAFLTAATIQIYSIFCDSMTHAPPIYGRLLSTFLLLYVLFIVIGTILFLLAWGPSFALPNKWLIFGGGKDGGSKQEAAPSSTTYIPRSLFFFEMVAKEDRGKWLGYFESTSIKEMEVKACMDHVFEAHLLSTKVRKKVRYIWLGKHFFHLAMLMLALLIVVGYIASIKA